MSARTHDARVYNSLKTATRKLVEAIGTQQDAASLTRVDQQHISSYGNAHGTKPDSFMPIDVVADLERDVGPIVSRKLASIAGYLLVRKPAGDGGRADYLIMARETGEALAAAGRVAADDGADAEAVDLAVREIDEAIEAALNMRAHLLTRQGGAA